MIVRVLLVDDEPDAAELFRQNFRREIRKARYDFLFATSAEEALELLETGEAPGVLVVLSDVNMPGMDGLQLLERVKGRWPDLPVLMITAYGDRGTERDAVSRGAAGLLTKPLDFPRLKSALVNLAADHGRAP